MKVLCTPAKVTTSGTVAGASTAGMPQMKRRIPDARPMTSAGTYLTVSIDDATPTAPAKAEKSASAAMTTARLGTATANRQAIMPTVTTASVGRTGNRARSETAMDPTNAAMFIATTHMLTVARWHLERIT